VILTVALFVGSLVVFAGWLASQGDLSRADQIAGVVSMFVALIGLPLAIVGLRESRSASPPGTSDEATGTDGRSSSTVPMQPSQVRRLAVWISVAAAMALMVWFESGGVIGRSVRTAGLSLINRFRDVAAPGQI
jgi:hypothetical protein